MALSHFLSYTQSNWSNDLSRPPKQKNVKNDSTYIQLSQPVLKTDAHKAEKDLRWDSVALHFWTDSSVLGNWTK